MTRRRATILIVDDDEVDIEIVTRGMKKRSLELDVVWRTDGCKALDLLRNELSPEQREHLIILLDLNMPNMNGHEFLAEIRADPLLQSTIIFVLTTSALESDRRRAYQRNIAGYFVKSNVGGLLDLLDGFSTHVEYPLLSPAGSIPDSMPSHLYGLR